MDLKTVTIKNVRLEFVELLREIRQDERRELAAILEDCIHAYLGQFEDDLDETVSGDIT